RNHSEDRKVEADFGVALGMHGLIEQRDQIENSNAKEQTRSEATASEIEAIRERRLVGQARRIEHAKLLAFLLVLEVGCHRGLLTLLEQVVVEVLCCRVVTGDFLELLLDNRAGLKASLKLYDLLLNLCLAPGQIGDAQIVLAKLCAQLLHLQR